MLGRNENVRRIDDKIETSNQTVLIKSTIFKLIVISLNAEV
jgi:hypothetical protein